MTATGLENMLDGRRQELREFEAAAEQARQLGKAVADMQEDLHRREKRRDVFAAIGKGHVECAAESYDARYHCTITWQPILSKLTGNELAAKDQVAIDHLRGEIAKAEAEIEKLLAQ